MRSHLAVFGLGFLLGCSRSETEPSVPLPPVRETLPRVEYRSDADPTICAAAPAELQRHLEEVEAALGIRGSDVITYVHFEDPESMEEVGCDPSGDGCVDGTTVYSHEFIDRQRAVQALLRGIGKPPPLLEHGLSTAFGYEQLAPFRRPAWRDLLQADVDNPPFAFAHTFTAGARLATHLFHTYGPEKLVSLYATTPEDADVEIFAELFAEIYEVSIDDAWTASEALHWLHICVGLTDNTHLDGRDNHSELTCPGRSSAPHVWTLEEETTLHFETTYRGLVVSCQPEIENQGLTSVLYAENHHVRLAKWSPGTYFLSSRQTSGDEQLRIFAETSIQGSCEEPAEPLRIEEAPETLMVTLRAGRDRHVALEWTGSEPLVYEETVLSFLSNQGNTLWLCDDCDGTECIEIDSGPLALPHGVSWIILEPSATFVASGRDVWMQARPADP